MVKRSRFAGGQAAREQLVKRNRAYLLMVVDDVVAGADLEHNVRPEQLPGGLAFVSRPGVAEAQV